MKMRSMVLFLSMGVLVFASGCASIVGGGGTQPVTFNSSPDGATVMLNGQVIGKTPLTVTIKRKSGQVLRFEKDGYEPVEKDFATHLNPWFWGNILIGGLLGSSTDGMTGAINEYMPDHYLVNLTPSGRIRAISSDMDSKRSDVKSYIMVNYSSIVGELNTAPGEYLNSLCSLLEIPEPDRPTACEKMKQMAGNTTDVAKFADDVVKAYIP